MKTQKPLLDYKWEILITASTFIFSLWLMWHTFSYKDGSILVASKVWSDFASHIPLIRSFSLGNNFPIEYPIFPGQPIRYHFLFYLIVGLLEKLGLRIDFALNILSSVSFSLLTLSIYLLGNYLFKNKAVGVLSTIFFIFNGSLSFLEFLKKHPLSTNTVSDIASNTTFPSFGPYDEKIVSAFWNLNIYTNQRHLALPLAFLLLLTLWTLKQNKPRITTTLLWGALLGMLPFSHSSIFIMALAVLGILFLLPSPHRKTILIILVTGITLALPRILFLKETSVFTPHLQPGYLISNNLNPTSFLEYWFMNFGLLIFLIPLGFILAPAPAKKVLIAFSSLFAIGNLIQFSPEIASNHKFFNVFLIVGNIFAAFAIIKLWQSRNLFLKTLVPLLIFLSTLSGIIDFFPIKNDEYLAIDDYPKNPDVKWIAENTPKNAVFLNSSYLYHPASLAGRKIFLGWPYFSWSAGYGTNTRDKKMKQIFSSTNLKTTCNLLKANKINYISITDPTNNTDFPINYDLFNKNFQAVYTNNHLTIYETEPSCQNKHRT